MLLPSSLPCLADELFIPDSNGTLNLQADNAFFIDSAFAMDNSALYVSVKNLHNNSMSTVQRHLNYQWLQMYSNPNEFTPITGGKALNEILRMGWKAYRDQNSNGSQSVLMRYTSGHGKIGKWVDYEVRLSGDKFNLSFEYEF